MALALARIEWHYFVKDSFLETDNYLIENVDKIRHIPGLFVQGRYDIVCPAMSAWHFHRAWPEAGLRNHP
jgi:proline iminopeptidase